MRNEWASGCHAPPLRTLRRRVTVGSQAHLFGLGCRNPHFPIVHILLSADSEHGPRSPFFLVSKQQHGGLTCSSGRLRTSAIWDQAGCWAGQRSGAWSPLNHLFVLRATRILSLLWVCPQIGPPAHHPPFIARSGGGDQESSAFLPSCRETQVCSGRQPGAVLVKGQHTL